MVYPENHMNDIYNYDNAIPPGNNNLQNTP